MPLSSNAKELEQEANLMSDHNVQVNPMCEQVSQNMQGPYALKPRYLNVGGSIFAFDIPIPEDGKDAIKLSQLTGMSVDDCTKIISLNKVESKIENGKEVIDKKKTKSNRDAIITILQAKANNVGDTLGEGGVRIAIETEDAYTKRMSKQIDLLKNIIQGGANILSIQEQPYKGLDTKRRNDIFEQVMKKAGYVLVADQESRDVGIWVKEGLESSKKTVTNTTLVKSVEKKPLRGCIAEIGNILCINLHADREEVKGEVVIALTQLITQAKKYAANKKPPLTISITGDMNLYQLDPDSKKALEKAGFTLEKVKGQDKFTQPTYEAFFIDKAPPIKQANPLPASKTKNSLIIVHPKYPPLPNYNEIKNRASLSNQDIKSMWAEVLKTNKNYDPHKDILDHMSELKLDTQYQLLTGYIAYQTEKGKPIPDGVQQALNGITQQLKSLAIKIQSPTIGVGSFLPDYFKINEKTTWTNKEITQMWELVLKNNTSYNADKDLIKHLSDISDLKTQGQLVTQFLKVYDKSPKQFPQVLNSLTKIRELKKNLDDKNNAALKMNSSVQNSNQTIKQAAPVANSPTTSTKEIKQKITNTNSNPVSVKQTTSASAKEVGIGQIQNESINKNSTPTSTTSEKPPKKAVTSTYGETFKLGRVHLFPAKIKKFQDYKKKYQDLTAEKYQALAEKYKGLKGDLLKKAILEDFKIRIQNTKSPEQLADEKTSILNSPECDILKDEQGALSTLLSKQTTAMADLASMFNQQKEILEENLDEENANNYKL